MARPSLTLIVMLVATTLCHRADHTHVLEGPACAFAPGAQPVPVSRVPTSHWASEARKLAGNRDTRVSTDRRCTHVVALWMHRDAEARGSIQLVRVLGVWDATGTEPTGTGAREAATARVGAAQWRTRVYTLPPRERCVCWGREVAFAVPSSDAVPQAGWVVVVAEGGLCLVPQGRGDACAVMEELAGVARGVPNPPGLPRLVDLVAPHVTHSRLPVAPGEPAPRGACYVLGPNARVRAFESATSGDPRVWGCVDPTPPAWGATWLDAPEAGGRTWGIRTYDLEGSFETSPVCGDAPDGIGSCTRVRALALAAVLACMTELVGGDASLSVIAVAVPLIADGPAWVALRVAFTLTRVLAAAALQGASSSSSNLPLLTQRRSRSYDNVVCLTVAVVAAAAMCPNRSGDFGAVVCVCILALVVAERREVVLCAAATRAHSASILIDAAEVTFVSVVGCFWGTAAVVARVVPATPYAYEVAVVVWFVVAPLVVAGRRDRMCLVDKPCAV